MRGGFILRNWVMCEPGGRLLRRCDSESEQPLVFDLLTVNKSVHKFAIARPANPVTVRDGFLGALFFGSKICHFCVGHSTSEVHLLRFK